MHPVVGGVEESVPVAPPSSGLEEDKSEGVPDLLVSVLVEALRLIHLLIPQISVFCI